MYILGIETSCDETGVAVYDSSFWESNQPAHLGLLGQSLYSQVKMHEIYGGVVPELASRDHIRLGLPLIEDCLKKSGLTISQIDGIAYTKGPGLAGALLVGTSIAKAMAFALSKKIIGIHHLEGHLLSPLLSPNIESSNTQDLFPFLALLVSGGHTQLMLVKDIGVYELLGETLDDAAGEAFDKTAKLLGLNYPGGPAVSLLAKQGTPGKFSLPRPLMHSKNLDFSFAGLKTAVLTQTKLKIQTDQILDQQFKADLSHAFVEAVVEVLCKKVKDAIHLTNCKTLVVAGGVGANEQLRAGLNVIAGQLGIQVLYPPLDLCTDNGAMIAFAGAVKLLKNPSLAESTLSFDVKPRWPLDQLIT
jgi:N6-L-threonylcarbamoyladenine synthase